VPLHIFFVKIRANFWLLAAGRWLLAMVPGATFKPFGQMGIPDIDWRGPNVS
jgi:hypothetical protein